MFKSFKRFTLKSITGLVFISLFSIAPVFGQEDEENNDSDSEFAVFLKNKRALSEKDLKNKKTGHYFTALPLANSDPDNGFGYGARVFYFYNGNDDSTLFRYTPYYHRIYAQYFATTKGREYHTINWDAPYFMSTKFRLRSFILYDKNINANYFSQGSRTLSALTTPGGTSYAKYADYNTDLRGITAGATNAKYNKFSYERPNWDASIERDLFYLGPGVLRPMFGLNFGKVTVSDYTNSTVDVDGTNATQNQTLLNRDAAQFGVTGYNGGWDNTIRLAMAYDSRDFEPDPNNGAFIEYMVESSTKAWGSDFDYTRFTFSHKVYYSPFDEYDVVLAGRGVYSFYTGSVPFFSQNLIGQTEGNQEVLGSLRSLRGYKRNRFIGNATALVNLEIRYTFFTFSVLGQHFGLIIVPFLDIGRVFDSVSQTTLGNWQKSYGAGFRIAWNQATIIMVDYGMSSEDAGLFINFNHIF